MQSICPLAAAGPIKLSPEKEKEFSSGLHVWVGCGGGGGQVFSGVLKSLWYSRVGCDHTNHSNGGERRIIPRENDWSALFLSNYVQERGRAIGSAMLQGGSVL